MVLWFNVCNKELLALRNNFRVTKKFLIAKFDCIIRKNFLFYFQLSFYDIYYELCPHLEDSDGNSNNSPTSSSKTAENGRRGNPWYTCGVKDVRYFIILEAAAKTCQILADITRSGLQWITRKFASQLSSLCRT